jgi:spermidine synthase
MPFVRPWSSKFIPYACLFLSGWTSLTYELIWIKQLRLVFGGTLYAISAVLCAFMAGLALGAWGISKYLQRPRREHLNLVRLYGKLEAAIGLYALAFPFLLQGLTAVYPHLVDPLSGSDFTRHGTEFILSALLMLPATFMMGATLPVIGSWSIGTRSANIFPNLSFLYALNTFGAVAGVLYTQFFATQFLGIQGTNQSAVVLNGLVFFLCWFWQPDEKVKEPASRRTQESAPLEEAVPSRGLGLMLLIVFGYSGLVALASEILWTRVLVFPLGSSLYSFAIILATFLFGIALGSAVAAKLLGRSRWVAKFLAVELAIGLFCLLMFPAFDILTEWTLKADQLFYALENTPGRTLMVRSLAAFAFMILPTVGFGLIYPLANHIHFNLFGNVTGTLGNSYAVNTIGGILGTALTPFLLVPLWGIQKTLFILYSVLIALSLAAWAWHRGNRLKQWAVSLTLCAGIIIGSYAALTPSTAAGQLGEHNLARVEINTSLEHLKLLDYKEGNFSTLSVVEDKRSGARTLYVDGFSTATVSHSVGGSAYMQAMGFVPMMLHPDPKRALVMCFGTGNTLGTVARFPGVEVDGVEIDRNVLSLAHWFAPWNHDAVNRDNVDVTVQDARGFIRWTDRTYDVITLEPMSPVQAGVNNLYSKEFYEQSRRRLNPGGLMMQWLPLHLVGSTDALAIVKTFQSVFLHTSVWNSYLTRIVLLVGSNEPHVLDKSRFDQQMKNDTVRRMAEEIGIYHFLDFMDFYLADGQSLAPLMDRAPMLTDDRPLLEHSPATLVPPLKRDTDETFLNLLQFRMGRFPPVRGISQEEVYFFQRNYEMRTARRFSVFSQRYQGPGAEAFANKQYRVGLERVQSFLDSHQGPFIRLSDSGWQ